MAARHISIPKSFSEGDDREWFSRFEICCRANGWNNKMKALKLPTLLEGEPLGIWLEAIEEEQGIRIWNDERKDSNKNGANGIFFPTRIPQLQNVAGGSDSSLPVRVEAIVRTSNGKIGKGST